MEFLLVAPLLIGITMLLVQWSVRLEADHVVQAAAREGAVAAARWDGSETAGNAAVNQYLDRLGPSIEDAHVQVHRGPAVARVTVAADVLTLVPGFHVHVSATVEQPVERFTP